MPGIKLDARGIAQVIELDGGMLALRLASIPWWSPKPGWGPYE